MPNGSGPQRKGRKKIPDAQRLAVWVRSGGRCVICNKYLLDGTMTYREVSLGELAHIVGQQQAAGSPRGLHSLAAADRDKADNLMLVCGDQHDEFDDPSTLDVFTVEKLTALKRRHEDRIRHVTGLGEDRSTTVIRMVAPVRGKEVELSRETAAATVIRSADRFPRFLESYHRHGLEIDLRNLPGEAEAGSDYYRIATARINAAIAKLNEGIANNDVAHLSVFGFARIPLLVYLGSRIDDTVPTDVYQRHREDESWQWSDTAPAAELALDVVNDVPADEDALLVLNLSGTIQPGEIPARLADMRAYRMSVTNMTPGPDILRNRASLDAFHAEIRNLFSTMEANAKAVRRLHLLSAIPLSAALILGRTRDPQVHPVLHLYDRTDTGYEFALEIA